MQARFQDCKAKGFDGIEPDNIDGYSNSTGFSLTSADQLAYNRALAEWAHGIGLSIGLKNDLDQASRLVGDFDWALNEQCYEFSECSSLKAFSQAGKAVWIAEYKDYGSQWASVCADSQANHFNTARYLLPLNAGRQPCTAPGSREASGLVPGLAGASPAVRVVALDEHPGVVAQLLGLERVEQRVGHRLDDARLRLSVEPALEDLDRDERHSVLLVSGGATVALRGLDVRGGLAERAGDAATENADGQQDPRP